jgi:release factor glutamine methyltransferase
MQPKPLDHPDRPKIRALIAAAEHTLAQGPHPERARLDAEALLLHLLRRNVPNRNRAWLVTHWDSPTMLDEGPELSALVERRRAGEPIQYIIGETEFYGLPFRVTPGVLIPRPETEHLVEKVIELAGRFLEPHIVDVGTGSGAIAITLAHHLPQASITAIDLSPAAIAIASENATMNNVSARIRFLQGDLFAPVAGELFDIVVSNPPYVPYADRDSLAIEVRDYEPALALFAGGDGLDIYRRLIPDAFSALAPGGHVALEIGFGQSVAVGELLTRSRFEEIEFVADLQAIPRVASAQRPQN